jgi:histone deacetylase 1/2
VVRYRSEERGAGPVPRFAQVNQVSIKKALKSFPEATKAAALKEMKQMLDKKVLRFTKVKDRRTLKPIKTFMFIKVKFKADGSFEKVKARLVANGPQQDPTSYSDEDCASPTAAIPFVFCVISIAATERRHIVFVDIAGAYLNASIEDLDIHVIIDPYLTSLLLSLDPTLQSFVYPDGSCTAKLDRALYGTHEASLRWYMTLASLAESNGFVKNSIDPCVLNKMVDSVQITMVIYVDDIMLTCTDMEVIDDVIVMFRSAFNEITVHDSDVNSYLGMTFTQNEESVEVTMEGFIVNLFNDIDVKGIVSTPAANNLFDVDPKSPVVDVSVSNNFRSVVMRLMYLAKRVRPDILLPVSFLSTRITRCTDGDVRKLDRVLKYLNGTRDMGIVLKYKPSYLHAFIDASYGVHDDAKSHSGLFVTIGRGPFIVASSKQKINTKSSYEAELVALSDKCSNVIWMREFLIAQGCTMGPATLREDNQSTIMSVLKGRGSSERTRHIKVHKFWMKDNIDRGEMVFMHTPTENMIADILTKPLQGDLFLRLRRVLLNWYY